VDKKTRFPYRSRNRVFPGNRRLPSLS